MSMSLLLSLSLSLSPVSGMLFPQDSVSREEKSLDGLWTFVREPANSAGFGFINGWFKKDLARFPNSTKFPVPSAYNDLGQDRGLRDMVGWVWYERRFFRPPSWPFNSSLRLRFAGVNYFASVWVDGEHLMNHTGGHLPFEGSVDKLGSGEHWVTVAVNNTLSHSTIPPGEFTYKDDTHRYPPGFFEQRPHFDFFNYAGILRPVSLLLLPALHISQLRIDAPFSNNTGKLLCQVGLSDPSRADGHSLEFLLRDPTGKQVLKHETSELIPLTLNVGEVIPWWPRGMGKAPVAYLYELEVRLRSSAELLDVYRLSVGFRTVTVDDKNLYVNGEKFYCHGFAMHEDADIRGRGYDPVIMIKDLNLLEWMGGNCFRTSHYPYAEQRFIEADRRGIVIIAETPAVGLAWFTAANLKLHKEMLEALIARDRNHPSVFVWSLANEPASEKASARDYFRSLVNMAHKLDPTRPVTIVISQEYYYDKTADLLDIICINRYYGWYIDAGRTEQIERSMMYDVNQWRAKFHKPLMVTEYGAGSITESNMDPPVMFSEAYQVQVIVEFHKAFDKLRGSGLTGEMIWNFADFMTAPGTTRVVGNRKGVLKRNRQPKMAAYVMRDRYLKMDKEFVYSRRG